MYVPTCKWDVEEIFHCDISFLFVWWNYRFDGKYLSESVPVDWLTIVCVLNVNSSIFSRVYTPTLYRIESIKPNRQITTPDSFKHGRHTCSRTESPKNRNEVSFLNGVLWACTEMIIYRLKSGRKISKFT